MHREVLLCVVLCGLCIASSHTAASRLVPAHDSHRLAKRQTATCPGVYFLEEPPSTLQCNPQPMGTLTVNCTFLNGIIDPGLTQTPIITIGWFFSSDGVIGNLVQSSAFQVRASLTAFRSVLVVRNAPPGAYFCSVSINGTTLVLDSNVLRVDKQTLQDLCLPQQLPTLQPPQPRCALRGIPLDPDVPLVPQSAVVQINTPTFITATPTTTPTATPTFTPTATATATPTFTPTPTPTFTPTATPTPTLILEPQEQDNNIGIGIAVGVTLGVVVSISTTGALIGTICLIKKRERNQFPKRKKKFRFNQSQQLPLPNPRQEPLLGAPPNRPPPTIPVEHIEMTEQTHTPQPYEVSNTRYSISPTKKVAEIQSAPKGDNEEEVEEGVIQERGQRTASTIYYSRPKFFTKTSRTFSTSTHGYGAGRDSSGSGVYISATHLEPLRLPLKKKTNKITEEELMLTEYEESTTSTDFLPSDSDYENDSDQSDIATIYEEADEEEEEVALESSEYLDIPDTWARARGDGNKNPETGQIKAAASAESYDEQPAYINTRIPHLEEAEETVHEVAYVNTRPNSAAKKSAAKGSTKSAPNESTKKRKPRIKRNKSNPLQATQEEQYTMLVHDMQTLPNVYSSASSERGYVNTAHQNS